MTTVYMVRHGESVGNAHFEATGERLPGVRPFGSELSVVGVQQAQALAAQFAGIEVDAWYTSPQERAFETAKLAAGDPTKHLSILWELSERDTEKEQDEAAAERFAKALARIVKDQNSKTVVVVSHGFVMRSFLAHIQGSQPLPHGSIANGSVIHLEHRGETFRVIETNGSNRSI